MKNRADDFVTPAEFRAAPVAGKPVRTEMPVEIREAKDGLVTFVMSTGNRDRYESTIAPAGWKTENFVRNACVLWMHDRRSLPIGRAHNVRVEGNALKCEVEFTKPELNAFGAQVGALVREKFLNTCSVGFAPERWDVNDDGGIDYKEQELLELSIVTLPGNADCEAQRALDAAAELAPAPVPATEQHADAQVDRMGALELTVKAHSDALAKMAPKEDPEREVEKTAPVPVTPAPVVAPPAQVLAPAPTVDAVRLTNEIAAAMKANGNDLAELLGH